MPLLGWQWAAETGTPAQHGDEVGHAGFLCPTVSGQSDPAFIERVGLFGTHSPEFGPAREFLARRSWLRLLRDVLRQSA